MRSIAMLGDATTTTSLALASSWGSDDAVVVEMDPSGGSLAAWLDVPVAPSLSSVVAAIHRAEAAGGTGREQIVDSMVRRAPGGLRYLPCPFTTREATRAVAEAMELVVPTLTRGPAVGPGDTALLDLGRCLPDALPGPVLRCDEVIAVHRQEPSSARAAAVRLERFAEVLDSLAGRRAATQLRPPIVLIVGDRPFDPAEIVAHVGADLLLELITLPEDPMAAAVLAGRSGVSERRLRRQPLLREARAAAARLDTLLGAATDPDGDRAVPHPARRSR